MNHQKIYENLINNTKALKRAKLKKDDPNYIYYENHHILPKCLNGSNDNNNLVLLTAKEHFIAHKLLTYIYPTERGIALAFYRMTYDKRRKVSSRDYAYAKLLISMVPMSNETKNKISKTLKSHNNTGWEHSTQTKNKISNSQSGVNNPMYNKDPWNKGKKDIYSEEHKAKLRKPKSEEHKAKLRKPKSEEHKAKLRKPNNKCWVKNVTLNISKLIDKSELEFYLLRNYSHGRIISQEQKNKQSLSMKGNIPWNKKLPTD